MTEALLSVEKLSVTFRDRQSNQPIPAVRDVSYVVNRGEVLGIVGESGSGKSVSSLAVMGLLPSNAQIAGSIRFDGHELLGQSDRALSRIRGKSIAMIFQDPLAALTPVFTIGRQISEALLLHDSSLSKRAAWSRSLELLRLVGIADAERRARAFPHEFSGGMRQRAMIAIAIANDPQLIIADEPTTALDVTIQAQILEVLQKAKEVTGAAVVLITHDLGVVAGNTDRVAVMYAGRIVEQAPVVPLFQKPLMPYTIGLLRSIPSMLTPAGSRLVAMEGRPPTPGELTLGCPFAPRCPAAQDRCRTTEPALMPISAGGADENQRASACLRADEIASGVLAREALFDERPVPSARATPPEAADPPTSGAVLAVSDVVRSFEQGRRTLFGRRTGAVRAVDGVSFSIEQGQTLGLVGESGSGKTTTIMQILELAGAERGTITVNGVDTAKLSASERRKLRTQIQIVFQDPMSSLDPRMTVHDIIAEPLTVHGIRTRDAANRVAELLAQVGLEPSHATRYPHEFSGGQRQRIGIARALAVRPRILVLDEPVSALDVSVQAGVINLLNDLKESLGLSYVFVAHDLAVVRHIADRVAVMYLGRIVEYGDRDAIFSAPRHPYTRALLSAIPVADPVTERERSRILLAGELLSATATPHGCAFRGRCPLYAELSLTEQGDCETKDPRPVPIDGREVACHHAAIGELPFS